MPATTAIIHARPTLCRKVRPQPWLAPITSIQNGVDVKASKAVLPSHTTMSAASPGGTVVWRRHGERRATAADRAPNPSPVASQRRPHSRPPSTAAST